MLKVCSNILLLANVLRENTLLKDKTIRQNM